MPGRVHARAPAGEAAEAARPAPDRYVNANDLPGAGNCSAALSLAAAAAGRWPEAHRCLARADGEFRYEEPDRRPVAAGAALAVRIRGLYRRHGG